MESSVIDEEEEGINTTTDSFLMLGHDAGVYYYLPQGSQQVVALRVDQHVEARLIGLVPDENYWMSRFGTKTGVSWKMARTSLLTTQHKVGIYNPERVRGRGAWWDHDGAALHLGDQVIIGGEPRAMSHSKKYIYEQSIPIRINYKNPLPVNRARALSEICDLVAWEKKINSRFLSGWCAIAPICGALEWRPHIWLTGPAGSGKTFLLDKIVRRIVGDIGLSVQSATTEAGLRQTLRHDARPVLFDEIEGADLRAQGRIQNILELARQASTETGARIVKGTTSGEAMSFSIRSCFAFSSIGVSATSRPDETRISVLGLIADGDRDRFSKLAALISDTIDDEYISRFTARSIRMIPVIRASARIFSTAAAVVLGSQRAGDQVGALLAGAWSLHFDTSPDAEEAEAWISKQDWSENKAQGEDTDENKCLSFLMQAIIKVPSKQGVREMSIAEALDIAAERKVTGPDEQEAAQNALGLYGFRGDPDGMIVSVSHSAIAKILRETEWAKTWGRTLKRIPKSHPTDNPVRFGSTRSRGVEIPYCEDSDASEDGR